MPQQPILIYQITSEPVVVPSAAESITVDKWDSSESPSFAPRRFMRVEADEIPRLGAQDAVTPDRWETPEPTVFARRRFLPPEGDEIPRVPTPAVPSVTLDQWDGHLPTIPFPRRAAASSASAHQMSGFTEIPPFDFLPWASSPPVMVFATRRFVHGESAGSPNTIFGEAQSLDQWDSQDFSQQLRRRFLPGDLESAPLPIFAPTLLVDAWDSHQARVARRYRFVVPEGEEIPRVPTPAVTLDQWFSQPARLPPRPQAPMLSGMQRGSGFTTVYVPDLSMWDGIDGTPDRRYRRFIVPETYELPRVPTPPAAMSLDQWAGHAGPIIRQRPFIRGLSVVTTDTPPASPLFDALVSSPAALPFRRPRFMASEVAESPSTIFVEPILLDKWMSRRSDVFSQAHWLVGRESRPIPTVWVESPTLDKWASRSGPVFSLPKFSAGFGAFTVGGQLQPPPPVTPPMVVFAAPSRPAALVSTLDILTWAAPPRPAALTSGARDLIYHAPSRPAALVSTLDLLLWVAPARPAALTSVARGGG